MQTNPQPDWERQIDRELKALPALRAPASIGRNVMAAVQARTTVPWYQLGWSAWPAGLQYASISILALALVALYAGLNQVEQPPELARWTGQGTEAVALAGSLLGVLRTLGMAVVVMVGKLGTPVIVSIAAAGVLGYAMCLALGTVYFRLAMARRP
jgi:hypothetical protein